MLITLTCKVWYVADAGHSFIVTHILSNWCQKVMHQSNMDFNFGNFYECKSSISLVVFFLAERCLVSSFIVSVGLFVGLTHQLVAF